MSWVHACNPSYSGGRDQEAQGLKLARANSLRDPILKIPNRKKGWWKGQVIESLPIKHETLS
jgi:hypothetical protein